MWGTIVAAAIPAITSAVSARRSRRQADEFSRTSYQRTVDDLRAAGLNPQLAYSQGPVRGQVPSVPDVGATLQEGITTARRLPLEKARTESETKLNEAHRLKALADAKLSQTHEAGARLDMVKTGLELERAEFKSQWWSSANDMLRRMRERTHERQKLGEPEDWSARSLKRLRDRLKSMKEGGEF